VRPLKVLVIPRDSNPYQELLHDPMRRSGAIIAYAGELTSSHTLNLLLLPFEFLARRAQGFRILHVHWVFGFALPGSGRSPRMRKLSRIWFEACLSVATKLQLRVVWTAHNVLPHDPVFDDDVRARRSLVRRSTLVIGHNAPALTALSQRGIEPRSSRVIPLGPMSEPEQFADLPAPGQGGRPRTVAFFGRVSPYKGLEQLLRAIPQVASPLRVVIAGECRDPEYRRLIEAEATSVPGVELRLRFLSEQELSRLFAEADAFVFPFTKVTTSSSVILGMAAGRLVVVPDMPPFADLPAEVALLYPPGGLSDALETVAEMSEAELRARGHRARVEVLVNDWDTGAARTLQAYRDALSMPSHAHV
jgi:glycosyltransferase involved in cell wall biosynthesis